LQFIHNSGYIHLDLKPANIFITFEGALKIGDFGMATSWPAQPGIEGEGDRTYIGPEILEGKYDKPADVFALGLIMLELAANMILPENGVSWQKLRSADFSDVEDLVRSVNSSSQTLASETFTIRTEDSMDLCEDAAGLEFDSLPMINCKRFWGGSTSSLSHNPANLFGSSPTRNLQRPPPFMTNPNHEHSLENVVSRMIDPNPQARPTIDQVLEVESVRWVKGRSRAGATIDEGPWGPGDEVLCDDAEMILHANTEKGRRASADTEMRED
jgi:mitosis inhibitor protein kinase SWE1